MPVNSDLINREAAILLLQQRRAIILRMAEHETDEIHAIDGCIDDIKGIPSEK
jgi:hypothetical protein